MLTDNVKRSHDENQSRMLSRIIAICKNNDTFRMCENIIFREGDRRQVLENVESMVDWLEFTITSLFVSRTK